jgi:hypothetical protein
VVTAGDATFFAAGGPRFPRRAFGQYRDAHSAPSADRRERQMPKLSDTQAVLLAAAAAPPLLACPWAEGWRCWRFATYPG